MNVTLWFPVIGNKLRVQNPIHKEFGLQQGKRVTIMHHKSTMVLTLLLLLQTYWVYEFIQLVTFWPCVGIFFYYYLIFIFLHVLEFIVVVLSIHGLFYFYKSCLTFSHVFFNYCYMKKITKNFTKLFIA